MSNCSNSTCGSWMWIIILLFLCGGCGNMGCVGGTNNDNCECSWLIILLLLLCCCGNGGSNSCGCSNGCNMCEA